MNDSNVKNSDKNLGKYNSWLQIVYAVKTPIGFIIFTMLLIEAFLSLAYSTGEGEQKTVALWGMLAIAFFVITIVSVFVYKNNNKLFFDLNSAPKRIEEFELTATQLKILHYIRNEFRLNSKVSQLKIERYMGFARCSAELFYRLETLVLQNFIEKERSPEDSHFLYWPSETDEGS